MNANFASIMPQVVAVWCEEQGHEVTLVCYTGFENLAEELPDDLDFVFIGAFTHAAQLSYALSNLLRAKGAITAIGGPHARCYPQDALKYFDYVLGFTDKAVICDILQDCSQHRPVGVHITAEQQPTELPGVRERWKFIEAILKKVPLLKMVPMIGSLGCPYTCSFCIDSVIPYQQLSFDVIKEDLRFLLQKFERPRVGWHDPNFGVRFNDYLDAIEEAVPPDSIDFFAESTLSLLSESHLKRLKRNGFKAILPGIESWFDLGTKSKSGTRNGMDKVRQVSDHINMVMSYIPYLQANFVFGLDTDEGPEPFELTKRFVDLAPGAYPAYTLLSAFGQAAPLNLEYQRANRIVPFPFHFLNTQHAMNVKPKNYSWPQFYDHLIDLTSYTFSWRAIANRYKAIKFPLWRWMNVLRSRSLQGVGRIKYYAEVRRRFDSDSQFRKFFEQESTELPRFYLDWMRKDLGPLWEWLPESALCHDPHAYLKSVKEREPTSSSLTEASTPDLLAAETGAS
ncbi:MAG: B12-binding domain-containing radical SAM protein [bacterium]